MNEGLLAQFIPQGGAHLYFHINTEQIQNTMRKIILNVAISLDGFIEGPNGEFDWCFMDQDYGMTDFMNRTDAIFFGRKSYQLVLDYGIGYYAYAKKYVFSKTLTEASSENTIIINEDLVEAVNKIKTEPGKDIWLFGGASLVTAFMQNDLLDELMLSVHPILLGSGKPLFQNIKERIKLELTNSQTFSTGLVQLFYNVLR